MSSPSLLRFSTLVVAASVVLGSAPCAEAMDLFHLSCQIVGSAAATGNYVDARQGSIHEQLRDGIEAGRLTDADVHSIRDQLEKLAAQEAKYKAKNGEMSGWQTMKLVFDLDRISKELGAALTERRGGPVDVVAERNQIATKLSEALNSKKLTQGEYDTLFATLTNIDNLIASSKDPSGQLATNDQVRIALALDNLNQRFSDGESQGQADLSAIDKRKNQLRAMIRQGVAQGHLSEDEVDDLRQQLYNYEEREAKMAKIGRPLTADEQLSLALELERFGAEISARLDNGIDVKITDRTIDHRKAALDQIFANALFSGDITVAEAQDLKNSLDQITATEASQRSEGAGKLTPEQTETLLIAVEQLKGRFSRLTFNRTKPWTGVDGLVNDIKQKIAAATAAKRLNAQENDDMQSQVSDVLVAKSNERNPQGFVTTDSALKLAAEISALEVQVVKVINERGAVALPDLQKRQKQVNKSLAEGIDLGKLTPAMASSLLAQFSSIVAAEALLKEGDNSSDPRAQLSVAASLDTLAASIKQCQGSNALPRVTLDQLKAEVDREITARTFNGKLTAKEAQGFRSEYNRIDKLEQASRASATGLDAGTAMNILNHLTTLLKNIKSTKNTAATH